MNGEIKAEGGALLKPFVASLLAGALEQGQRNRARMAPPERREAMNGEIKATGARLPQGESGDGRQNENCKVNGGQ